MRRQLAVALFATLIGLAFGFWLGSSDERAPAPLETAEDFPWPHDAPTPEQLIYEQPARMARQIDALRAQTPGEIDLYLIAFAGDGTERVFGNEADYAARLFAQRFGTAGRSIVLRNDAPAFADAPLASWSNLEAALDGLAATMDRDEDILFVYLTSHGNEEHLLSVLMPPLPLDPLDPEGLAEMLAARGFRNKVVLVNACFSGGFVPALKGTGTLVITAARADRSSFGCGSESDITWFGDAYLARALNRTDDFIAAFELATKDIAAWEALDDIEASEPRIDVGPGIDATLARWRASRTPGAALAFDSTRETP